MPKNIVSHTNLEQGGYSWKIELDLSTKDFGSTIVPPSVAASSRFYIYIRTAGAIGLSGPVEIRQGPTKNPSTHDTNMLANINVNPTGQSSAFGDVHGEFLSIRLPQNLPVLGTVEIIVIVKDR